MDAPINRRFRRLGIVILVVGLLSATGVFLTTKPDDGSSDPDAMGFSRRDEYQLERIGGKAAVLGAQFNDWLASLWHGRTLAYTLAVLSFSSSLGCFFLAQRLIELPPPENPTDSKNA